MYFKSRVEAGRKLADHIVRKYQGQQCAVVGLSDGGVMVGTQIATRLHAVLTMLLSEAIELPREPEAIAGVNQDGSFSYNNAYSPGELEDLLGEYHTLIEQEKMQKMQDLQRLQGRKSLIRKELVRDRTIILVSDGLGNGFSLDVAAEFLKPIEYKKLVIATPVASVRAVDRMHILADEIFCLSVVEDYISTDHYYDVRDIPPHDMIVRAIEEIVEHWNDA